MQKSSNFASGGLKGITLLSSLFLQALNTEAASPEPLRESELFAELKGSAPFFLMAGPNVIESEEHCMKMCRQIKAVTDSLGIRLVFKSSFDKANRTNVSSFRGPGMEEGLRYGLETCVRKEAILCITLVGWRAGWVDSGTPI